MAMKTTQASSAMIGTKVIEARRTTPTPIPTVLVLGPISLRRYPQAGEAGYVAIEKVRGRLGERQGSSALQQSGSMHAGSQALHYELEHDL